MFLTIFATVKVNQKVLADLWQNDNGYWNGRAFD